MENPIVKINNGLIEFTDYERLLSEAKEVSEMVSSIEVTEENIKESKKLIAKVNKSINELEDKRKEVKREILKPYNAFETQVKEIVNIVKAADTIVRNQVRELEEKERLEKYNEIKELWECRLQQYDLSNIFNADDFIVNKHLNKTTSMTKIESEMIEFLEKSERDIKTLTSMEHADELIREYKNCKDVSIAMNIVQDKYKEIEEVNKVIAESAEVKKKVCFVVSSENRKFVELLFKENNIEFEVNEL